eukprot:TRINITY_DN20367_c0_g1_i3.p1 TRINITY_DN20367_c0_g1~~TRINITY_DN20367_c0_g1_i3.p1  ORF type:complete len:253 (-),score=67.96 TRINITY_DN20367_c0_g1_i3:19-777(-)
MMPREDLAAAFRENTAPRLSFASGEALSTLTNTELALIDIESRVEEIAATLPSAAKDTLTDLRTEVALLESKAKQLETKGVDDVYTGDLSSGKQVAKDIKKDMLGRLEALFARFEVIFAVIKSRMSEDSYSCPSTGYDGSTTAGRAAAYAKNTNARMSMASEESLGKLGQTNKEELASFKTELALLESKAKQLEGSGIDDIYTGDLQSGKQAAKDSKKDMLKRLETLFGRIDDTFANLKSRLESRPRAESME